MKVLTTSGPFIMHGNASLMQLSDIDVGQLRIRPARRSIEGPAGAVTVEPLVMQLLVELSRRAGQVISRREIFERCWGSAAVGDDSLNRIIAMLRRALEEAGEGLVTIETVPRTGYVLRLHHQTRNGPDRGQTDADVSRAIGEGLDSVRLGLPEPDHLRLEILRQAVASKPENSKAWGTLALLCRQAAEYAAPPTTSEFVARCEAAARPALALDPFQVEALVALATVAPLFGRWREARSQLIAITAKAETPFVAIHELAIVEMATGRLRAAKTLVDGLIATDPLAACLCYKSIYQHWSIGDLAGMDHVADRAIQLWPTHAAVWTARFWTLAYTDRPYAALSMLDDSNPRPDIPSPALRLLRAAASAVASADPSAMDAAAAASRQAAQAGPAGAIAALFALGLLKRTEEQRDVANAYYLREGPTPVPVRRTEAEPSINDQHRRATQILFTPACEALRADTRFPTLCARMGLSAYWETSGLRPDFLNT
jgi:DNA-binding winged helix-turn-helix (wHTH) protein